VLEVVIPAYNEELRLGPTLESLRTFATSSSASLAGSRVEVIVVDNASTDRTADVARRHSSPELPVRVVRCPVRGKGAATAAGVAATEGEFVAFMDADGATDLGALDEGVRLLRVGADLAIGSRAVDGSDVSARHTTMRSHGAAVYRSLTNRIVPGIADTQCGFKVMRGEVARTLFSDLTIAGFSFDVELLALAQRRLHRITEYPVRWVDQPGSTFRPALHGLASFVDLARVRWRMRRVPQQAVARIHPVVPLQPALATVGAVADA